MASVDFEKEREFFVSFYDENRNLLEQVGKVSQTLISQLTHEVEGVEITYRLKNREECINKFSSKYRTDLEASKTNYEIKNYVTDLIGIRIICLCEDEVDNVVEILKREFISVDTTDKTSELENEENKFGYRAFHIDLNFNDQRKNFPEYEKIKDFQFEVQIRTIVQDAWSVIDHKINYKRNISDKKLKRRIVRLAALFELADQEFKYIKDQISQTQESGKVAPESFDTNEKLDVIGLLRLLNKNFGGYNFHQSGVDLFIDDITKLNPQISVKFLDEEINKNKTLLDKYREYQQERGKNLNPYTMIRHILYLADKGEYERSLFDLQRFNFDEWLKLESEVKTKTK